LHCWSRILLKSDIVCRSYDNVHRGLLFPGQCTWQVIITGPPSAKWQNLVIIGPIFIIFSLLNSETICGVRREYNYHLPSNLLPHYLVKSKWLTIQLYSTVNSVHSDKKKRIIAVNVHEECYFLVFLHRLIYIMCLKCPPSAQMRLLSRECHWSTDASIVHCSLLCQTFFFITERNE